LVRPSPKVCVGVGDGEGGGKGHSKRREDMEGVREITNAGEGLI
jgi:hypothetical protein